MPPHELVLDGALAAPHLLELTESTSSVSMLLRQWCLPENSSSTLFKPIRKQAYEYAKAIDLSITIAQTGFNLCEEVVSFAELFDSTSEKQRQEHLRDMQELARKGVENSAQAHSSFRDVRITLEKLLRDARCQTRTITGQKQLDALEKGIVTLERFSACIQLYISCWNRLKTDQRSQEERHGMLVYNYNAIRQQGVLDTWRNLRKDYVAYTCTIRFIQDEHPGSWTKIRDQRDGYYRTSPEVDADSSKFCGLQRTPKLMLIPKSGPVDSGQKRLRASVKDLLWSRHAVNRKVNNSGFKLKIQYQEIGAHKTGHEVLNGFKKLMSRNVHLWIKQDIGESYSQNERFRVQPQAPKCTNDLKVRMDVTWQDHAERVEETLLPIIHPHVLCTQEQIEGRQTMFPIGSETKTQTNVILAELPPSEMLQEVYDDCITVQGQHPKLCIDPNYLSLPLEGQPSTASSDRTSSVGTTRCSVAPSSTVTEYGLFYIIRDLGSSRDLYSLQNQINDTTLHS